MPLARDEGLSTHTASGSHPVRQPAGCGRIAHETCPSLGNTAGQPAVPRLQVLAHRPPALLALRHRPAPVGPRAEVLLCRAARCTAAQERLERGLWVKQGRAEHLHAAFRWLARARCSRRSGAPFSGRGAILAGSVVTPDQAGPPPKRTTSTVISSTGEPSRNSHAHR